MQWRVGYFSKWTVGRFEMGSWLLIGQLVIKCTVGRFMSALVVKYWRYVAGWDGTVGR